MKLTSRQEEILNKLVQDYIELAKPVSSKLLEKRHKFGLSPATLRIEMQKLTDKGFIYQPHTSAGRVPTDKGYRFFVNNLLRQNKKERGDFQNIKNIFDVSDDFRFADQITKFLAESSSNFGFLHFSQEHISWKEGWPELFEEPEFESKDFIFDFSEFLENFEKRADELVENSGIKIYIGKESKFPKAKDFSIITAKCLLPPDNRETILSILGPKRMDYQKNINLLNYLVNELKG